MELRRPTLADKETVLDMMAEFEDIIRERRVEFSMVTRSLRAQKNAVKEDSAGENKNSRFLPMGNRLLS